MHVKFISSGSPDVPYSGTTAPCSPHSYAPAYNLGNEYHPAAAHNYPGVIEVIEYADSENGVVNNMWYI